MIDLLEELGKKTPRYSQKHRKLLEGFAKKGAIDYHEKTEKSYDLGKFFNNFYEFYIYAAFIGLYTMNPVPIMDNEETKTFGVPMRDWNSNGSGQTVQYLWMAMLVVSELDFNELENMDQKDVEREMRNISRLIEAYANGGFDFIESKVAENKAFFDDDDCFVKLLKEVN
ncbi:MAG: hypothetical protein JXR34_08825 [Bacteroidales bacterium]|nr:hypothetical protein [Bacteroidales bacterium]